MYHDLEAVVDLARDDIDAGEYTRARVTLDTIITRGGPCANAASLLLAKLLIRCGDAVGAIKTLDEIHPHVTRDQMGEHCLHTMMAHAFSGDLDTAELFAGLLVEPEPDVISPAVAIEIVHARASVAWVAGKVEDAEAILSSCGHHAYPRDVARHRQLEIAIAGRRDDHAAQVRLAAAALDAIAASKPPEIPLGASILRTLAILAHEMPQPPDILELLFKTYRDLPWTPELGADRVIAAVSIAWIRAYQGDVLGSIRFSHEAFAAAQTIPWRVNALAHRAAIKRAHGEHGSSLEDLQDALAYAERVDWNETPDEERLGLVLLAELSAAVDAPGAHALLLRSAFLRQSGNQRLAFHHNKRIRALAQRTAGIVSQASGDRKIATRSYQAAYDVFATLRCEMRAADVALRLYEVTKEADWIAKATMHARAWPASPIARQLATIAVGVGEHPQIPKLAPRQAEVFRGLLDGLTAAKIAERIGSKENTVRNQIKTLYQKFDVRTQPELIAEARRRGLG